MFSLLTDKTGISFTIVKGETVDARTRSSQEKRPIYTLGTKVCKR